MKDEQQILVDNMKSFGVSATSGVGGGVMVLILTMGLPVNSEQVDAQIADAQHQTDTLKVRVDATLPELISTIHEQGQIIHKLEIQIEKIKGKLEAKDVLIASIAEKTETAKKVAANAVRSASRLMGRLETGLNQIISFQSRIDRMDDKIDRMPRSRSPLNFYRPRDWNLDNMAESSTQARAPDGFPDNGH